MTATPDRMDNQSLLNVFRDSAPRLGLKEAIERELLAPVRCVRVKTNIDLTRVRFNGSDYRYRDIEEKLSVPERDMLIVSTYIDHVKGRPGVTFCVNVTHSETLARIYRQKGIAAESVSGRMSAAQREETLARYESGELQMLCACDLLNEGWDSPRTEVLIMARPTLSRVLYVQQLGRGTRLYPGKKCLYVFDFIDNTTRYAQSLSVHRLFNTNHYTPGALVAAPAEMMEKEHCELEACAIPAEIAQMGLYVDRVEEVDIFDWRTEVSGMLTTAELEIELGIGGGTASNWVRAGKLIPDHSIEMGSRTYHYFNIDRLDDIRRAFGLKVHSKASRKQDFLNFVSEMDMSSSYKPVMLIALLDCVDGDGRCSIGDLAIRFRRFYTHRAEAGLPAELGRNRMGKAVALSDSDVTQVLLTMPFEKFERRKFLRREKDTAWVRFDKALWKSLGNDDLDEVRRLSEQAIEQYYRRGANNDG